MRWLALGLLLLTGCDDDPGEPVPGTSEDCDCGPDDAAPVDPDAAVADAAPADAAAPDADPCTFHQEPADDVPPAQIHTPRWAFEPWISKDISDRDDTYAFVEGFQERDIPVGVVVLDSPWETNYNTFVPNPDRYPDLPGMVADLRARGVRTVLWVTQMVNFASYDLERGGDRYPGPAENYQEGKDCGFYVDGGWLFNWWKGRGSGVDFFDPQAVSWWHRQQDALLEAGIAGWKLDFGEQYLVNDPIQTDDGPKTLQQYSEAYYADFYDYGASKVGTDEFVTMVRPWDESYQWEGRFFARPEHAPVAWVGDNRRDWVGLVDALDHIFRSAVAGYVVVGSDVGGYLDVDDRNFNIEVPPNREAFVRWTAMGALVPFMQLHGRANLTPWTVEEQPEETAAIYRYWSHVHHQLVPFFYSLAEEAYAGRALQTIRPVGNTPEDWADDWRYRLGDALLVAPIFAAGGVRDVELPPGRWYDWWALGADAVEGPVTLDDYDASDPGRIPVFFADGAIVPLQADSDVTGFGSEAAADALTLLVFPAEAGSSFDVHEPDGVVSVSAGPGEVRLTATTRPTVLRIRAEAAPTQVDGEAAPVADRAALDAADAAWFFDPDTRALWVKRPASADDWTVTWGD